MTTMMPTPPMLLLRPEAYRHASLHASTAALAFPSLVLSWVAVFFLTYRTVLRLLTRLPHTTTPSVSASASTSASSSFSLSWLLPVLPASAIEEWSNRSVSTLHAFIAFYGSIDWYLRDSHMIKTRADYGFLNSPMCDYYLGITLAYLVFDLLRLLYFTIFAAVPIAANGSMFIHHIVIILGYSLGVRHHYGTFYMALFLNNEITTPLLNARFLMAERGMKQTRAYAVNETLFVVGFFISRIAGNALVLYHMQVSLPAIWQEVPQKGLPVPVFYLLPAMAYTHVALQTYWFALLVRMAVRKLRLALASSSTSSSLKTPASLASLSPSKALAYDNNLTGISPTINVPMKDGLPPRLNDSDFTRSLTPPPIVETGGQKAARVLGLPPAGLTGRPMKKLGLVEVANEKAAEVLGIRDSPTPPSVRKRRSLVPASGRGEKEGAYP
ncbi:hypothetical protein HDU90_002039 [Geranomyces variabilis]|nr:hypothetical protein HDU90_002039 [Geranomyces variabilis]